MGVRDSYEQGVFCWVDLSTTDQAAAKDFYHHLFDWSFEDIPMGDGPPYSIALKNSRRVAAIFSMPEGQREQNLPPHWQSYISVKNLEETVQTVLAHGGQVEFPPFDVLDDGRMAVIKDPTGALVHLWQAKAHFGAELVNEANTFCWAELQTRGAAKAYPFYQEVFGWQIDIDEAPPNYATCQVKGQLNCGIFDMDKVNLPPHVPCRWAVYFNVSNLDATLGKVEQLGGKALMEPITIEPGRFTTINDPQGAVVTIMELNNPDA